MRHQPLTLDVLRIETPCPAAWEQMRGDGRRRFCDSCGKHVHNAEAMTRAQVETLLAEHHGTGVCMQLHPREDGTIRLRDASPLRRAGRWLACAAAVALAALPGCGSRQNGSGDASVTGEVNRTLRGAVAVQPALTGDVQMVVDEPATRPAAATTPPPPATPAPTARS